MSRTGTGVANVTKDKRIMELQDLAAAALHQIEFWKATAEAASKAGGAMMPLIRPSEPVLKRLWDAVNEQPVL